MAWSRAEVLLLVVIVLLLLIIFGVGVTPGKVW
jgi:hypothetical protein